MTISTKAKIWTDDTFMALPKDGHRYELVDGELVDMGNSGMEHGEIVEYFENETQLVWVIHPDEKYALVYHSPEPDRFLRSMDALEGEEILPGFSVLIADLFEEWDF